MTSWQRPRVRRMPSVTPSSVAVDGLPRGKAAGAGDPVWLVDPNGFVVLRYAPGADPGDLRTDLARLLRIN